MHWLSRKPCDLTNNVHAVGAAGAEPAAFAEQGWRDWEANLLQRAREIPNAREGRANASDLRSVFRVSPRASAE
jgi:hypothetical protein